MITVGQEELTIDLDIVAEGAITKEKIKTRE